MRIIAGEARGRKIAVPSIHGVRPTLDRVREALFSMLHGMLCDKEVLDLFAGSGSLGIEALSRGARHAVFVDRNRACLRTLAENLRLCGFEERGTLVHGVIPDCFLDLVKKHTSKYDIVFIDPPYRMAIDVSVLESLYHFSLLRENARIILEHNRRQDMDYLPGSFKVDRKRVYGEVAITFLAYQQEK